MVAAAPAKREKPAVRLGKPRRMRPAAEKEREFGASAFRGAISARDVKKGPANGASRRKKSARGRFPRKLAGPTADRFRAIYRDPPDPVARDNVRPIDRLARTDRDPAWQVAPDTIAQPERAGILKRPDQFSAIKKIDPVVLPFGRVGDDR